MRRAAVAGMGEAEPTVALLPGLDPLTMGYRQRDRLLDPRQRDLVYDRGGNATSSVLVDGVIVGVWDVSDVPTSGCSGP